MKAINLTNNLNQILRGPENAPLEGAEYEEPPMTKITGSNDRGQTEFVLKGNDVFSSLERIVQESGDDSRITEIKIYRPSVKPEFYKVKPLTRMTLNEIPSEHLYEPQDTGDLSYLQELPRLRSLTMVGRFAGQLSYMAGLKGMENLELHGTEFTGQLSDLAGLSELTNLNLYKSGRITGQASDLLKNPKLESVDLRYTGKKEEIKRNRRGDYSRIVYTGITGKSSDMAGLKNLKEINYDHTGITGHPSDLPGVDVLPRPPVTMPALYLGAVTDGVKWARKTFFPSLEKTYASK